MLCICSCNTRSNMSSPCQFVYKLDFAKKKKDQMMKPKKYLPVLNESKHQYWIPFPTVLLLLLLQPSGLFWPCTGLTQIFFFMFQHKRVRGKKLSETRLGLLAKWQESSLFLGKFDQSTVGKMPTF